MIIRLGCYSEKQKKKTWIVKNGKAFNLESPGETISDKGVKPFAEKHGIPETFRALIKGDTLKLTDDITRYDEYQIKFMKEGKTKKK